MVESNYPNKKHKTMTYV